MFGIPTSRKGKILMKIIGVKNEISSITLRGGSWTFNLTTGESEFKGRKLSEKEKQKVEELKAQLKQLESELKIVEMEKDFENEDNA